MLYTDAAKIFITLIFTVFFGLVIFVIYLIIEPEVNSNEYYYANNSSHNNAQKNNDLTCNYDNFVGSIDHHDLNERVIEIAGGNSEYFCLKRTGMDRWEIYRK